MNNSVMVRRVTYVCAIVVLLLPLYFLGNPSVRGKDGEAKESGGTLAQLRDHYDLGQNDLGELDPASESVRLATLGLRGAAITVLWQNAYHYKKEKEWDALSATLNQIAILQPHFMKVWDHQAHNLAYNVSVEFDDYRQRYQWVKKGMRYLIKGSKFNKTRTEMPYELGWFFGNKLGVSDERKQFRTLYSDDDPFHEEVNETANMDLTQKAGLGPNGKPDSWRGGTLWYDRAYAMVERGSKPAKSPHLFFRMGAQWQMKHSEAIQKDGFLGAAARNAWNVSQDRWFEFGQRPIRTSFGDTIFMNELKVANEQVAKLEEEFRVFCGGAYEKVRDEKLSTLSDEQRAAFEKPELERNFLDMQLAIQAMGIITVEPSDITSELPEEKQVDALRYIRQIEAAKQRVLHIEIYRNQINYAYWQARCVAEQEDEALAARRSLFDANELLSEGKLDEALENYELAWENWSKLFSKHPAMMIDDSADDVLDSIQRYLQLLDQPDLPEGFALQEFLQFREMAEGDLADPVLMNLISEWPERYPGRSFLKEVIPRSQEFQKEMAAMKEQELKEDAESSSPESPDAGEASEAGQEATTETPEKESAGDEGANEPSGENPMSKEDDESNEPAAGESEQADEPKQESNEAKSEKPGEGNSPKPEPEKPQPEKPVTETEAKKPEAKEPEVEDPKPVDPKAEDPSES